MEVYGWVQDVEEDVGTVNYLYPLVAFEWGDSSARLTCFIRIRYLLHSTRLCLEIANLKRYLQRLAHDSV
jgi:hypothetical protein